MLSWRLGLTFDFSGCYKWIGHVIIIREIVNIRLSDLLNYLEIVENGKIIEKLLEKNLLRE